MNEAMHDIDTAFRKAVRYHQSGRLDQAREIYAKILEIVPDHPGALDHSGVIAIESGDDETALSLISKAIRIRPNNPFFCNNLGNALRRQGNYDQAVAAFKKALKLRPDLKEVHNNLGNVLKDLGKLDEAIESFQAALQLKPDYAEAHHNLSLTLLTQGNFTRGWEEYEWRFQKAGWRSIYPYRFIKPLWDGESFVGKRLFVHNEQGFGDIFQFIRYIPMVKDLGGTVIFETRKEIFEILKGFPGIDELMEMSPSGKHLEDFDFYVPLLTLPKVFETCLETIPAEVPYIRADPEKSKYWKDRLPESGFKVGLVWAGKTMHHGTRKRSCSLESFLCLADIPDIHLIGLQKGAAALQAGLFLDRINIMNLGESFQDFSDTAAVIENLDLVITVDTAVAHLAGALGKPVWILLAFSPDWRWLLNRDETPWYPTMKLFRQPKPGDWQAVLDKVSHGLRTHLKDRHLLNSQQNPASGMEVQKRLQLAVRYHQSGALLKAREHYEAILKHQPNHGDALHLLGLIAHEKQELASAETLINKAVALFPEDPYFQNSLGLVYKSEGKHRAAEKYYTKALILKPDLVEAANNLGVLYQETERPEAALSCFQNALSYNPALQEIHNNMGNTLKAMGRWDEALYHYQQALSIKPDHAEACNNMGVLCHARGRYNAALSHYKKAMEIAPTWAEVHINIGVTYQYMGLLESALSHFKNAIALAPHNADAHFHCAFILLLMGDLEKGWREYEWRLNKEDWIRTHTYHHNARRWDGSDFKGETLFVHAEQGLGDTLQFVRYLPLVKQRGGKVIFETNQNLAGLLRGIPGADAVITPSRTGRMHYDLHIPLMSLPGLFKTTLKNIPAEVPYVFADPDKAAFWYDRIKGPGLKIGLVWTGKPVADDNRPCDLRYFHPLLDIPGLRFFGLQKGEAAMQAEDPTCKGILENLGEMFQDFTDTAAAVAYLDLVISIDTSVAHLAGAMGKQTWTLLPFAPDWRWLLDRNDSHWYPFMRLFRQPKPGDWESVISKIKTELEKQVNNH